MCEISARATVHPQAVIRSPLELVVVVVTPGSTSRCYACHLNKKVTGLWCA